MGAPGKLQQLITDICPWFLRQKNIATFLEAVGLVLDGSLDGLGTGLALSQPLRCIPDAFPALAKDRKRRSYSQEPDPSKRQRLRRFRQFARHLGSEYGTEIDLQPYFLPGGLPTIRSVHQAGDGSVSVWRSLAPDGTYTEDVISPSNFDYDGRWTDWSRYFLFVDFTGASVAGPPLYGAGHLYGDGTLYGGGLSSGQIGDIAQICIDDNAPHAWLNSVIAVWPPATIPVTGTPTQDSDGRWSLPNGANTWASPVDPTTGKATRPIGYQWLYDNNAP